MCSGWSCLFPRVWSWAAGSSSRWSESGGCSPTTGLGGAVVLGYGPLSFSAVSTFPCSRCDFGLVPRPLLLPCPYGHSLGCFLPTALFQRAETFRFRGPRDSGSACLAPQQPSFPLAPALSSKLDSYKLRRILVKKPLKGLVASFENAKPSFTLEFTC